MRAKLKHMTKVRTRERVLKACGPKCAQAEIWLENCFKIQQKIFIQLQQLYSHSRKIFIQLQQLYSHSKKYSLNFINQQLYLLSRKKIYSTSTVGCCSTSTSKICIQGLNTQDPTCSQDTDQIQHGGNHRRRYQCFTALDIVGLQSWRLLVETAPHSIQN